MYGDDFSEEEIQKWYAEEEEASYAQRESRGVAHIDQYQMLDYVHFFRRLSAKSFKVCLAFGCAGGEELVPLSRHVNRFIAIEPAKKWWKSHIAGIPVTYLQPNPLGDVPCADRSVDLITCFSVLHHIPNVSRVIAEFSRVLKPQGLLLIREPNNTLGDWRQRRVGGSGSKNERGIPQRWLEDTFRRNGLRILSRSYAMVPATMHLAGTLNIPFPFNHRAMTWFDAALGKLTSWNIHYHRDSIFKKIAPGTNCYILERQA